MAPQESEPQAATEASTPAKVHRFDRRPLYAGLALTLLGSLAPFLPWTDEIEARVTDLLFRHARIDPPRADPRIVHLDIDENALLSVGRWPWPRSRLADAIDVRGECGAKVIALDLLLSEPARQPEEDDRLARAFQQSPARIVLAFDLRARGQRIGDIWSDAEGRRRSQAILALLRTDITLDTEQVVRRAGLRGRRALRFRQEAGQWRQLAADAMAEDLFRKQSLSLAAMEEAMVPVGEQVARSWYPERRILEKAVDRRQSVGLLTLHLPEVKERYRAEVADVVEAPLEPLAAHAYAVGFVTYQGHQDADGHVRRLPLWKAYRGYMVPQLGLAAAAALLDIPLTAVGIAPDATYLGNTRLPQDHGGFRIPWPRIDAEYGWIGLLRQVDADSASRGHISLGRPVALAKARRRLQAQKKTLRTIASVLVGFISGFGKQDLDDPQRAAEAYAEIDGEAEFRIEDAKGVAKQDLEEEDKYFIEWAALRKAIGEAEQEIARAKLELHAAVDGRLVFIGWNAAGQLVDTVPTAAGAGTPGVVVHAMVANAALTGNVFTVAPRSAGMLVALLLGAAAALSTSRARPFFAGVLTLTYATAFAAGNALLIFDRYHVVLAMVVPVATTFLSWAGATAVRLIQELRERARMTRQFGSRIARPLFEYLLQNPDVIALEGENREVTSFFSDLAGFTAVSESMESRRTVALLNEYMSAMNQELTERYAYVNKFLGDGVMAVWGALATNTPHAERACHAALACRRRLELLNREWSYRGIPQLSMRIGIATGEVVVGDCGAPPDLRDFTVIGDAVNLAARLESANKQFDSGILINGRTKRRIPEDLLTRPLGKITVVGQERTTEVHELMDEKERADSTLLERIELTDEAVRLFLDGKLEAARKVWSRLRDSHGDSKLIRLYLAEIERLLAAPSGEFDGIIHLSAK